jgi:hypothetical protein
MMDTVTSIRQLALTRCNRHALNGLASLKQAIALIKELPAATDSIEQERRDLIVRRLQCAHLEMMAIVFSTDTNDLGGSSEEHLLN